MTVTKIPTQRTPNLPTNRAIPHMVRKSVQQNLARFPVRQRLIIGGAASSILALLALFIGVSVYNSAYSLFESIATNSSVKVDSAERSLAYIAGVDTSVADFLITASDDPSHWQDITDFHDQFQNFRSEMFNLRVNLNNPAELKPYKDAESFAFDEFWQHASQAIDSEKNGDTVTAIKEYLIADNYMENQIAPALQKLEALNFTSMVSTEQEAARQLYLDIILLAFSSIAVAVLLTILSFWLRRKIRRYLTPGIDIALVLSWIITIAMLLEMLSLPGQMKQMVEDAYYSVTAGARILALANQANRIESAMLLDPQHAAFWQSTFDGFVEQVALRMCGQAKCLNNTFVYAGAVDSVTPDAKQRADAISAKDLERIDKITPMVANITFSGEAKQLEAARSAYVDYLALDARLRQFIANQQFEEAAALDTGKAPGQSDEAFGRFADAMQKEIAINRQVFDDTWQSVRDNLPPHRLELAVIGYLLLIATVTMGVVQRTREL